jgi:16S rRNA (guanine966-N2)-methyltransferase
MRIVAGRFGGRSLRGPASDHIRPTSDRLRESLFNIIEHRWDAGVDGARVIDLFAGTGALALEALSRGASFALLVDEGAEARALIRENVEALGVGGETRLFRRDARRLGEAPSDDRFDLAFLDPPYGRGLAEPALVALHQGNWLRDGAMVVVEEATRAGFSAPEPDFATLEHRAFGDTTLYFLRYDSKPALKEEEQR